ncbi:MAG: hypothetical protein ABJP34_00910 [Erythrobacter sp.]
MNKQKTIKTASHAHKPRMLIKCSAFAIAIATASSVTAQDEQASTQAQQSIAYSDSRAREWQPNDEFEIRFRADTLVVEPVLNLGLIGSPRTAVRGEKVEFQSYSNYPAFISKVEVRVLQAGASPDAEPIAILAVNSDGHASWDAPQDGPDALSYSLRVYGKDGGFDETALEELTLVGKRLKPLIEPGEIEQEGRENFGEIDEASRRNIKLDGLMATVTGKALAGDRVKVSGQNVPVSPNGSWAAQYIVPRTKAGMSVAITRDGKTVKEISQSFAIPKDDWFIVGQGDLTLGTSFGNGPSRAVSGDPTDGRDYLLGRAAFYAKGVVGNDVRVTASLDTGEELLKDVFSNLDRKDPRQLLRRLDSDQFYPTFGDDSTLVEDAPTQGSFYLRVEKDDNQFVLGNFIADFRGAELAQLDRGLFGALVDLNSNATTDFGERKYQLTAFASDPGTVPGRDEFRGTGGSLYFLTRQDLTVGSERVRVEIRDRDTGIVLESRDLHPQQDYDFDALQGRVVLLRPLASIASTGNVVRAGSSDGHVPVLVIRYEYTPTALDLSGYTIGGRGTAWLGEKLRLGATAQRDTLEGADQTLLGADVLLRQTAGTYFKAEFAQTRGVGFGQSNSVDGGLTFTDIAAPGVTGQTAQAYRFEAAANFGELAGKSTDLGTISAYFEHFDGGFGSTSRLTAGDTERWGLKGEIPVGQSTKIAAAYNQLSTGLGENSTGTFDLNQSFGSGLSGSLGLRYEDRNQGVSFNSTQNGERLDAAVQLGYKHPLDNGKIYVFGQATLDRDASRSRNNRAGIGGNVEISERLSLETEVSGGDGGLGVDTQLNHRLGDGSEAYVGYALYADRTDTALEPQNLFTRSNRGTLTIGSRQRFSDALSVYGENRVGIGGRAPSLTRSFGLNFDPTDRLAISGSFENGRIDDVSTGLFERTAATFAVGYTAPGIRLGTGVEARFEDGANVDQTVWLVRNSANIAVNPDWRFIGRLNFAIADQDGPSLRAADFVEGVAGFAYRPVNNERLNALFRYTYFEDLGPVGQISDGGTVQNPKQTSQILSLDVNYDLSEKLTVGAKYGFRKGRVSLGRDSDVFVSSDAHLGVIRADYEVLRHWDVLVEGRVLTASLAEDRQFGALAAVYRHINENVKIGVGYSFADFSDDLTDQSFDSNGFFINLLGKF